MLTGFALIVAIFLVVRGESVHQIAITLISRMLPAFVLALLLSMSYIIGSVADVDPMADENGMRFRVNLDIQKDWIIPSDSIAEIVCFPAICQRHSDQCPLCTPLAPGRDSVDDSGQCHGRDQQDGR